LEFARVKFWKLLTNHYRSRAASFRQLAVKSDRTTYLRHASPRSAWPGPQRVQLQNAPPAEVLNYV
jgi:hypothetical protein